MTVLPEFVEFPKMPRLSREIVISEKIDGTNAQICITEDGDIFAGSRTRWINVHDDNFGFANWVAGNRIALFELGPGRHFGEWWGHGIQRGYGLKERRFSLFNTHRWSESRPEICHVVPVLHKGLFDTAMINAIVEELRFTGSRAAPGFMNPEGVVVYHVAGNLGFKKTLEKDESPKGAQ